MVTSSPDKDSQKSMPYKLGSRRGLICEIKDWLLGTAKTSPLSSPLNCSRGGWTSLLPIMPDVLLPITTGLTSLPLDTTRMVKVVLVGAELGDITIDGYQVTNGHVSESIAAKDVDAGDGQSRFDIT
jgi:hypothetical protein